MRIVFVEMSNEFCGRERGLPDLGCSTRNIPIVIDCGTIKQDSKLRAHTVRTRHLQCMHWGTRTTACSVNTPPTDA